MTDRFVSLSIGSTLILKACGFVEAHQARILDVSEDFLRIRVGHCWYERWLLKNALRRPLDVLLSIREVTAEDRRRMSRSRLPHTAYCALDVEIHAADTSWSAIDFQEESRRILWALRSHFMACA